MLLQGFAEAAGQIADSFGYPGAAMILQNLLPLGETILVTRRTRANEAMVVSLAAALDAAGLTP